MLLGKRSKTNEMKLPNNETRFVIIDMKKTKKRLLENSKDQKRNLKKTENESNFNENRSCKTLNFKNKLGHKTTESFCLKYCF